MTLYLTEHDVEQIVTMPDALRVVEEAFRALGEQSATNRPRQRVRVPDGVLQVMPGGLPARGYVGFKYYASFRGKTRFWFHLLDAHSGDLLAVMQADRLGQQRTGAASGVASKYLARPDAATLGLLGTGWQAESQLQAVCAVLPIRIARCYSREAERRTAFAQKLGAQLGIELRAVDSAEEAAREADIVVTATNTREPVLRGEWLAPGAHVNAIGSNRAEAREIDDETVSRSALIVVDSIEQSKIESGDLIGPVERGRLSWDQIHELGAVVAGKIAGRRNRDDITLFKSNGIAVEDVALGGWVYERAREIGAGKEIVI
ncbi:MAG: ornithine cyclodeaminase family protein [Chloroflexi bacterium]|nr:ornithine cyclodeaminase family protein [Chloroflexota bacterium]